MRLELDHSKPVIMNLIIHFALDAGADTVVFGVKTVDELKENVQSFNSEKRMKNY